MELSTRPRSSLRTTSAFAGFRFPAEVIVVAVRWYLRYNRCCAAYGVATVPGVSVCWSGVSSASMAVASDAKTVLAAIVAAAMLVASDKTARHDR